MRAPLCLSPDGVKFRDLHPDRRANQGSLSNSSLVVRLGRALLQSMELTPFPLVILAWSLHFPLPQSFCPGSPPPFLTLTLTLTTTLLQRNEPRAVRRANSRPAVLDGLVADAELGEVEPDHLRLDLDLVELLAAVDADDGANHLRHDDHVAQVRLDQVGLLVGLGRLLRLAQLLDQPHRLALQAAVEAAAGAGVHDVAELFGGEVEESVCLKGDVISVLFRVDGVIWMRGFRAACRQGLRAGVSS